jgi:hypothetical protein
MSHELDVTGLDGSNPLGFLAAIGTLAELSGALPTSVAMSWSCRDGTWHPRLHTEVPASRADIVAHLAKRLGVDGSKAKCDANVVEQLDAADEDLVEAKRALKKALEDIKKRKLRGADRQQAIDQETGPLVADLEAKRARWLRLLEQTSPSPELALGKDPGASPDHFAFTARRVVERLRTHPDERACADLLAAFGCEAVFDEKSNRITTTTFCFVTGSGHQYFLQTIRDLLTRVDAPRIEQSLFVAMPHGDEQCSLRWDPVEDRRYAMMWSDPTSSGNKAKTNWAMNLLAYRGLQLLPCVPDSRRLATTGFARREGRPEWTWPIWTVPIGVHTLRSVLAMRELQTDLPDRPTLLARGIAEVFRCARIQVGNPPLHKLNFAPARTV